MSYQPDQKTNEELKRYYQTSQSYRDDLLTHDTEFLRPFLLLIQRYVRPPSTVLDLGCGTGLSTRLLSEAGYEVVGADLSTLFLLEEKRVHPATSLLACDALQLPFAEETFDAVVGFEFIEHIPDIPACLLEMKRVLKTYGHVILHSPNLLSPYLPAFDWIRMFFGGEGRPVFAESRAQAWQWFKSNLSISLKKKCSRNPRFLYRKPDLSERHIGGDADSVYLANPMDVARFLKQNGCEINQVGHAMSLKNKLIVALTPNFAPYMGVVAYKRPLKA